MRGMMTVTTMAEEATNMKKGFTILELLVASLLLGMLVTILTMIFNQSSIAWRTGTASVVNLDRVRQNIATIREESDNLYIWNNNVYKLLSPWDENGNVRSRGEIGNGLTVQNATQSDAIQYSKLKSQLKSLNGITTMENIEPVDVGGAGSGAQPQYSYTVNVKSAGPNKVANDYDDIWSYPDEFD